MPLPKRIIEPVHISRDTVPNADQCSLQNELEAVTNGTLANAIRQLSSLSHHAEDMFGELAREAHIIASRANSLQARLDKLAIKTTQLDSTVEEVSLQEIHRRKAFKSAVVFDQQVVSRDTMPTAMLETYNQCAKPPPLYKLNPYREDGKDGMKFYTDPDYFFQLWRQEMLKDTERMMLDRGKKQPHKPRSAESSGGGQKKRVRRPHSTREQQKQNAMRQGEYIMSNNDKQHYGIGTAQQSSYEESEYMDHQRPPSRPNSIELRRSFSQHDNGGIIYSPTIAGNHHRHSPPTIADYRDMSYGTATLMYNNHESQYPTMQQSNHHQIMSPGSCNNMAMSPCGNEMFSPNGTPTRSRINSQRPSQPPPAPPSTTNSSSSTPSACNTPTRGRSMSAGRETLPPPPPPPPLEMDLPAAPSPPPEMLWSSSLHSPPSCNIPPPPPPPPPPLYSSTPNGSQSPPMVIANGDLRKSPIKSIITITSPNRLSTPNKTPSDLNSLVGSSGKSSATKHSMCVTNGPQTDPRSDLLKAIRDGIKLRKVEKIEAKEGERVNTLHDVASILARRVAVEISDSDSASDDSEYDSDGWTDKEPANIPPNVVASK